MCLCPSNVVRRRISSRNCKRRKIWTQIHIISGRNWPLFSLLSSYYCDTIPPPSQSSSSSSLVIFSGEKSQCTQNTVDHKTILIIIIIITTIIITIITIITMIITAIIMTILFRRWERGGWSNSAGAGGRRPQTLLSHQVVSFNLDIIIIIIICGYVYLKLYCRPMLVIILTSEDLRDVNYFDNVENIRIEKSYILNIYIAKGTTDPRVEFIWTSSYTNLDKISISESRLCINFKISTKHQYLDLT